jgi:hypothetical protein
MNLTYIAKAAINITGMAIYSAFAMNFLKKFNELKTLSDESHDIY